MRKTLAYLLSALWLAVGATAWSAQKKAAPAAKAKPTASKSKTAATKGASGKSSSKSKRTGSKKAAPKVTRRNRQMTPTPDRYRQIQQALAEKGFLDENAVTGSWGQSSVDALKKFQRAQNIPETGKINSLSLIALGLGPAHGVGGAKAAAAQPADAPPAEPALPDSSEPR